MNDNPVLNESNRESLKCLTEGKTHFLKELLLEDTLVNVGLSSINPKSNTSHLSLSLSFSFCFALWSYLPFLSTKG